MLSAPPPSILIREATSRDHKQLLKLARQLDSINLPLEAAELGNLIKRSTQSFRGRMHDHTHAVYLFCAEHVPSRRVVGASMIIGKHGTPTSPHYYLEMDSDERYSHTLKRMFRHTYLRLRYSMDGPTEIGGLIVDPKYRRHPERVGRQLSWVRLLYIASHRDRFERQVLAEMLPPIGPDYQNRFWDHYGRAVTGLTFREADRLSTGDKEFIRALFPDSPLYTFLLPEEVRQSLGQVGDETKGAVRLLEQAGMRFLGHIDPFDGGPYYGAEVDELIPVKAYRRLHARVGGSPADPSAPGERFMIARESATRGFRALAVQANLDGTHVNVGSSVMKTLGATARDSLDLVPLP